MKKIWIVIVLILSVLLLTPLVGADFGPKAKIYIHFTGDTSNLYVTLLAKKEGNGPWQNLKEQENIDDQGIDSEILAKFMSYEDDYYLWTLVYQINANNDYCWAYYPPDDFKLLIYNASTDTFRISSNYARYAFTSYYTVDLTANSLVLENSYNYQREILELVVRIVITLVIEMLVALLFRYKTKKAYLTIFGANLITQIVLNVILNLQIYYNGLFILSTGFIYLVAEIIVFILEALIYMLVIRNRSKTINITYALVANALSFILGIVLLFVW